jgi:hypothetical protein
MLHAVNTQHGLQRIGPSAIARLGIKRLDDFHHVLPWQNLLHAGEENLFSGLTALSAEFTIGEGELMAHDVPLGCAPDEYDDLISGTCSHLPKEGANKQVILPKLTRLKFRGSGPIFPHKHIESAYLGYFFHHFWRYFRFLLRSLPLTYHLVHPKQVGQVNNIASWLSFFSSPLYLAFTKLNCRLMMRNGCSTQVTDAGFHAFDVDGRFVLARMLLQGFYLAGTLGDQPVHIHLPAPRAVALW